MYETISDNAQNFNIFRKRDYIKYLMVYEFSTLVR